MKLGTNRIFQAQIRPSAVPQRSFSDASVRERRAHCHDNRSRTVTALKERLIAALFVGLLGCASQDRPQSRVALNLNTPRDAAMTFVRAIGQGDVVTAKAASIGTESQKHWIDALAGLIDGLRSVDGALLRRFGGSAERIDIDLCDSLRPLSEGAESEVAAATVNENGLEARLVPLGRPMSIQVPYATQLRKDKGVWKVDLPAVYQQKPQLSVGAGSAEMETYLQAGRALKTVAREIASGQYKTLDAARNAIAERMIRLNR